MVYLGVDCIPGGSWCSIFNGEVRHYPFSKSRKDIADHVDRMIGLSYTHDRNDCRILAVVRGYKRISFNKMYSDKTLARAILMERTCSILEARGVVVAPVLLSDAAIGLGIPLDDVTGEIHRSSVLKMISKSYKKLFVDMDKAEKEKHSVSTMLALYNKKYANIRGRIF